MKKSWILIVIATVAVIAGVLALRFFGDEWLHSPQDDVIARIGGEYRLDESCSEDMSFVDDWDTAPRIGGVLSIRISEDGLALGDICYDWSKVTIAEEDVYTQLQITDASIICDYNNSDKKLYVYSYSDQVDGVYGVYIK